MFSTIPGGDKGDDLLALMDSTWKTDQVTNHRTTSVMKTPSNFYRYLFTFHTTGEIQSCRVYPKQLAVDKLKLYSF